LFVKSLKIGRLKVGKLKVGNRRLKITDCKLQIEDLNYPKGMSMANIDN